MDDRRDTFAIKGAPAIPCQHPKEEKVKIFVAAVVCLYVGMYA
jgi:hypothetical protein